MNSFRTGLILQYPHGAGGAWLAQVLDCCMHDRSWVWNPGPSWHDLRSTILTGHWFEKTGKSVLHLANPDARFNFWTYYWGKKILRTAPVRRPDGKRWIASIYHERSDWINSGYWLLDQCRRIHKYPATTGFVIDWIDMINHGDKAWQTLCEFLDHNQMHNHWTVLQWHSAVDNYRSSIWTPKLHRTLGVSYRIWSLAWLQSRAIYPPFHLAENFFEPCLTEWLSTYRDEIENYTEKTTYQLG